MAARARRALPEVQEELHWNRDDRIWEFPTSAVAAVVAAVGRKLPGMEVQQPPKFVVKLFMQPAAGVEAPSSNSSCSAVASSRQSTGQGTPCQHACS
jgi:hypothetical protein